MRSFFPRRFAIAAALAALAAAPSTPPSYASHIGGATYGGRTSTGAGISLTVSPDGGSISRLTLRYTSGGCTIAVDVQGGAIPIQGHTFSYTTSFGTPLTITGSFVDAGTAFGSVGVQPPSLPGGATGGCQGGLSSWTATSGALPPAPPPSPGALTVTPNSPYVAGLNGVVVQGSGPASAVAARIAADSGHGVRALWARVEGQWRFFLPDTPGIDGGLGSFAGAASILAVLA